MNPSAPKPTWSVIVSSCDAYSDLWPFFFHFFEKHWPDAPKPVHLVSNFRRFENPAVKTLAVGPDKSWGDTIHAALEQIPDDFVVFVLDDFFLNTPVPAGWVDSLVAQLDTAKGDFVSLYNLAPGEKLVEGLPLLSRIEERMECPGFHASLFHRSYLMVTRVASPEFGLSRIPVMRFSMPWSNVKFSAPPAHAFALLFSRGGT